METMIIKQFLEKQKIRLKLPQRLIDAKKQQKSLKFEIWRLRKRVFTLQAYATRFMSAETESLY
jgi:hypothetical protein